MKTMAYVVVKERPVENYYRYLHKSFRNEEGNVETECICYLGRADGPQDRETGVGEVPFEYIDDVREHIPRRGTGKTGKFMQKFDTLHVDGEEVEVRVEESIEDKELKRVKMIVSDYGMKHWKSIDKLITKKQAENVSTIQFYSSYGGMKWNDKPLAGDYGPITGAVRLYNVEGKTPENIRNTAIHELMHPTIDNLYKTQKEQRRKELDPMTDEFIQEKGKKNLAPAAYLWDKHEEAYEKQKERNFTTSYSEELEKKGKKTQAMKENIADSAVYLESNPEYVEKHIPETGEVVEDMYAWENDEFP